MAKRRIAPKAGQKDIVLKPVRPNAGIAAEYRKRLLRLVDAMNKSVTYWLEAAYKKNEPVIAQDALPAAELQKAVRALVRQWQRNFNRASEQLADYFATAVEDRSDAALKKILRDGGYSVEFKMTKGMQDIFRSTVNANVSLIKSIPQKYLTEVEGMVMRSVQTGRDLSELSKDLQKQFGITRRRAELIARDQNNKATSAFNRVRQQELGITKAIWVHSHAGKEPRPTHLKMNGKQYDINEGMYDPAVGKNIFPGELINCRCVGRSVIPGFS